MKKFLSFILILSGFIGASSLFAQAQEEKNIYLYTGTVNLPNGKTYQAKFVMNEFGKIKVKLFDERGRKYKTYETHTGDIDSTTTGEFKGTQNPSLISDLNNRVGLKFRKENNHWRGYLGRVIEQDGELQHRDYIEISLNNERRVPLTKFSGRDSQGRLVEAYFNPCDGQFVLTREGQNLMESSYVMSGHDFHKLVPREKGRPNIYTYNFSWRKDNADVNGAFRLGMAWESTRSNKMTVLLPKGDGSTMNPLDPRGAENRDGMTLTAEGEVNFLDCLNQKYPDGKDVVSVGRTEVSEQSNCSDKKMQERLREMLDEIDENESFLFARDLDDVVD